jgi:folate-binding protein YgfZ
MAVTEAAEVSLDGQYRLLREEAGLVDRSERGKLIVHGTEAADYLQGQLTNDIEALQPPGAGSPGSGCYAALLDRKGHMQGDMRVLRTADGELWIDTEAVAAQRVRKHLDMYRIGRDAELRDAGEECSILSVIGPEAAAKLARAAELAESAVPRDPEHAHRVFTLAGAECRVVAGDAGVDVICPRDAAGAVRDALAAAGVAEVGPEAAEILRVESGRPRFGREMSEATIPAEAGLDERAVSFTKGCFIGQETVARLHYKGKPNRRLAGLRLDAPARDGDPIVLGERDLGTIGTAVLSPAEGPIALAIIRREASPGDRVAVGDGIGAEVVEPRFRN